MKDIDVIVVKQEKISEQSLHFNIVDVQSQSVNGETNADKNSSNNDESDDFDFEDIPIDIKYEPIL